MHLKDKSLTNRGDDGCLPAESEDRSMEQKARLTLRKNLVCSVGTGAFAVLKVEVHSSWDRILSVGYILEGIEKNLFARG